jgi:hypothetical protein
MAAPLFECMAIELSRFSGGAPSYFTTDEADAVAWAKANTSRDQQVTIDVCAPGDVSTFAVRTIHHDGSDSGWRCWRDGSFVGPISLDALFNRKPAVA